MRLAVGGSHERRPKSHRRAANADAGWLRSLPLGARYGIAVVVTAAAVAATVVLIALLSE